MSTFDEYLSQPCDEPGCTDTATHNGTSRSCAPGHKFCNRHINWDKGYPHARDD